MQLLKTNSPQELGEAIQAAGIDISRWGTECKSLEELWQEAEYDDCHLVRDEDGKISRRVRVVVVTIHLNRPGSPWIYPWGGTAGAPHTKHSFGFLRTV